MLQPSGGVPKGWERPSGSVHARVGRLQAGDREQARLDRLHRPATGCDPELLAVSGATELLGRSARHSGSKRLATPQTASVQGWLVGGLEGFSHRAIASVRSNDAVASGFGGCRD